MDMVSFVLLSHEQALRRQLDITANNIANANTVGYKRETALFHEYVEEAKDAPIEDARKTSFVLDYGAIHDVRQGAFQVTGNPLDVMIEGPGHLNVEGPEGAVHYTRAGFIKMLENGDLTTSTGHRLLDVDGRPINIPEEQRRSLSITKNGTIMANDAVVARLAITRFADENQLEVRGNNLLFGEGGRLLPAAEARVVSGGVEGSNVESIVETTNMVQIMRSYQTSQQMIETLSDMRKQTINRIGRVDR
jgi:flagellar basal-body rod protein FlgF